MVDAHAESSGLEADLAELLNTHSAENPSGTPDFILAAYLMGCLDVFNKTVTHRGHWRGESTELPALQNLQDLNEHEVPLVAYIKGDRNVIGTAKVKVTPGEVLMEGKIVAEAVGVLGDDQLKGLSVDIGEPKDSLTPDKTGTRFERYMRGDLGG